MTEGVGLIVEAAALTSLAATASSFFGGGKKKKAQITAAENQHMYEQSAIKSVNFTLKAIQRQIEKHTEPYQVAAEVGRIYPRNYDTALANSLKTYTATFGASKARAAVANLSSWIKPIYIKAQGIVEQMKSERLKQIAAPALAATAAADTAKMQALAMVNQMQSQASMRKPPPTAAPTTSAPSTTSMLLIAAAIAAAWIFTKGKKS